MWRSLPCFAKIAGRRRWRIVAIVVPLLTVPVDGRGQNPPDIWCSPTECPSELPRPRQHLVNLGVNALLGGLATVVQQAVRWELHWEDVLAGAAGGGVGYAGKVLAAERFFGAGLLGRQVAAMGASMAMCIRDPFI